MQISTFNGADGLSARAWLQKLQTYFTLDPMAEEDAIQFVALHFDGMAYDRWHHGLITQGHALVSTFDEFCQKGLTRFDKNDVEEYFKELATLKQTSSLNEYIEAFEQISVQVQNISPRRVIFLFVDGLLDPLRGLVKSFEPPSLEEAIKRAMTLESVFPPRKKYIAHNMPAKQSFSAKSNSYGQPRIVTTVSKHDSSMMSSFGKEKSAQRQPFKPSSSSTSVPAKAFGKERDELRRKQLCFSCKAPWTPGHRCQGRGQMHLIQVVSESDNSEKDSESGSDNEGYETPPEDVTQGGTLATLNGLTTYKTIKVPGSTMGEDVIVLIDGGATHNFIDERLVAKKRLKAEPFLVLMLLQEMVMCFVVGFLRTLKSALKIMS